METKKQKRMPKEMFRSWLRNRTVPPITRSSSMRRSKLFEPEPIETVVGRNAVVSRI